MVSRRTFRHLSFFHRVFKRLKKIKSLYKLFLIYRIFKKTQERLRVFTNYSAQDEIRVFFELESQFGVICTDKEAEEVYVR